MLPKYCSISILCILVLITPLYALHCYDCEDCEKDKVEYEECDRDKDACMKVTLNGVVAKTCINRNFCSAEKLEEGLSNAWSKVKNIFLNENNVKPTERQFSCCFEDYCNSGNRLGYGFGASLFFLGITYFLN